MIIITILVGNTIVANATPTDDHSSESISSVSSHQLVMSLNKSSGTHLAGSRIINLQKLHDAIQTITQHSVACQSPVELIGELRRNGLCSTLLAKCSKCNEEITFTSCNKVELKKPDGKVRSTYQANVEAVIGQMATGGGCNNLEELLCTIGIPSMSKPTFIEIERLLGSFFEAYLGELMLQAGEEEKQIAIKIMNTIRMCHQSL